MSRSYKRNPVWKDNNKARQYWKRQASKKVRHSICCSGGMFRKIYDSWNITDFKYRCFNMKNTKKEMSK